MKSFKLNQYPKSVAMVLRRILREPGGIDVTAECVLTEQEVYSFLDSPESHSIKSVGPKTIEFICKEFDIQPPDAWKIRIDKYHEDRKDKVERKIKKERYVTVKINKVDADKLLFYLAEVNAAKIPTHPYNNLINKIIIPLQQKFDWKE